MTTIELIEGKWPVVSCTAPECRARVVWANTERGKRMMVDADPAPGGNLLLTGMSKVIPPTAVVQPVHKAFGRTDLRKSHFATCVAAEQFRGRRR